MKTHNKVPNILQKCLSVTSQCMLSSDIKETLKL